MTTLYFPVDRETGASAFGTALVPIETRYASAAELCAAIRAAAADAPEAPRAFPDGAYIMHYASWQDVFGNWIHGRGAGPVMPEPERIRVEFHHGANGARGSLTVENLRPALLQLADRVQHARAAYDGEPRRAPKRPKRPPSSSPHVAARALWTEGMRADAISLAQNVGAIYFGNGGKGLPFPYMNAEPVEAAGHSFTVGRCIPTGRFVILHSRSGQSAHQDPGFSSASAALDWIEERAADEDWCSKLNAAISTAAPFDQVAALARYMAEDAPESAPAAANDPAAPIDPDPAPTAPSAAVPISAEHAPVVAHQSREDFDGATKTAAEALERLTALFAPDGTRRRLIDGAKHGAIGARAGLAAELARLADSKHWHGWRAARGALDALAAADAAPADCTPLATQPASDPLPTQFEPLPGDSGASCGPSQPEIDRLMSAFADAIAAPQRPEPCKHPPARLYCGHARNADGITRPWIACCDCGDVLAGGAERTPDPLPAIPDAAQPVADAVAIEALATARHFRERAAAEPDSADSHLRMANRFEARAAVAGIPWPASIPRAYSDARTAAARRPGPPDSGSRPPGTHSYAVRAGVSAAGLIPPTTTHKEQTP